MSTAINPSPKIAAFLSVLSLANAIELGSSPLLSSWDVSEEAGFLTNEILRCSWTDGEADYSVVFTEEGIHEGAFDADGSFVCKDSEGDKMRIKMYSMKLIGPGAEANTVSAAERERHAVIGRQLIDTALGKTFYGKALAEAKMVKGVSEAEMEMLHRWANGSQTAIDALSLQTVGNRLLAF